MRTSRTLSWALAGLFLHACTGKPDADPVDPDPTDTPVDTDLDDSGEVDSQASWEDVRPILQEHCSRCHSADRLSTYRRLETYEEVTALRSNILGKLRVPPSRGLRMPVASNHVSDAGCTPAHPTINDKRISEAEVARLTDFLQRDDHASYTDTLPPLAPPVVAELPGATVLTSTTYQVLNDGFLPHPGGVTPEYMEEFGYDERDFDQMEDDWFCIQFDPGRTDPGFLTGMQVQTDSGQIFLNSQLVIDTTGGSDAARAATDERGADWYRCDAGLGFSGSIPLWRTVPGGEAVVLPEDTGLRFEPGWTFVLRVDFHTHFDAAEFERLDQDGFIDRDAGTMTWNDRATLRTTWATPGDIDRELDWMVVGPRDQAERDAFAVAPGRSTVRFAADVPVAADGDHAVFSAEVGMGKLGRAASLTTDDGASCVTSNTDFQPKWIEQVVYAEDASPTLSADSPLELTCTYDNDTSEAVVWGSESEATVWGRKERCSAVVFYYPRR
jgi:hypothetical protein